MTRSSSLVVCALAIVGMAALVMGVAPVGVPVGGTSVLVYLGLAAMSIQWVAFIPAYLKRTETFYDIVGTLTFAVLVSAAWSVAAVGKHLDARRSVLTILVLIWAGRLGFYLGRRIKKVGKDGRFDAIKQNTAQFLMAWTLQGVWTFLTSLPVLLIVTASKPGPPLTWIDFIGWGLWAIGMSIEVIADAQKDRFRVRADKETEWIDEGLWSLAQHPNYFGEILLWTGLFVSGLHLYSGIAWLSVLSPIFVYVLLTQMSGIPMLRERALKRWGQNPEYVAYLQKTRRLLPLPRGSK